jgi:5-methyltetrahydrofolate--homocysteine methyltransferase
VTHTVVGSETREVVIGFDRPFVIIGERINPTGRKLLAEEMRNGDYSRVTADAIAQVEAGAHMLDVNAGIPLADEPRILAEVVQLVQSITDVPLSIDSSIVAALEAGLAVYKGRRSDWRPCFHWWLNMGPQWWRSAMTRRAYPRTPMSASRSPGGL